MLIISWARLSRQRHCHLVIRQATLTGKEAETMKVVIYVLGFLWISAGTIAILYTDDYRAFFAALMTRLERLWLALIPAVFGLLLLIAASATTHRGVISVFGLLGIAKGALIYFNPGGILETSKNWLNDLSDQGYRLVGIVALVLGMVVISWIR
jgi:uncharacterized protein YjeT (DUF2065 family)